MTESKTLTVETEIKFIVTDKEGKSVDRYNTGDYFSRREFHVKRKLMACDISTDQGGTNESRSLYTWELLEKFSKEGFETFAKFDNINLANVFCKSLNEMNQEDLLKLINEDEYKHSVKL